MCVIVGFLVGVLYLSLLYVGVFIHKVFRADCFSYARKLSWGIYGEGCAL